jgi:hypothetical protein
MELVLGVREKSAAQSPPDRMVSGNQTSTFIAKEELVVGPSTMEEPSKARARAKPAIYSLKKSQTGTCKHRKVGEDSSARVLRFTVFRSVKAFADASSLTPKSSLSRHQ